MPPPATVTVMSNFSVFSVSSSGWRTIMHEVSRPKNPLGREMYRKLKVYGGAEHPHTAQQPQALEL
jgi:ribosomal protein L13